MLHTVSTSRELYQALMFAKGGDSIRLASGNYGALTLDAEQGFDADFDGTVTLVSADPDAPAVFTGLDLTGVSNLTFDDVAFVAEEGAEEDAFSVSDSEYVTFQDTRVDGDGDGLAITNSVGVSVIGEDGFSSWTHGIYATDDSAISFSDAPDLTPLSPPSTETESPTISTLSASVTETQSATAPDAAPSLASTAVTSEPVVLNAVATTTSTGPISAARSGATVTVTNLSELKTALSAAQGGETIQLAAGNYGALNLSNMNFSTPVTITSADPNAPASFSGMKLSSVSNLSFDDVVFDYTYQAGDPVWKYPFYVVNSQNISFDNSVFDGDLASGTGTAADGLGYAQGLWVRNSDTVSVTNSEFYDWHRAAKFEYSQDLTIQGNDIHSIRSDGLDLLANINTLVEGNYIHDFVGRADWVDHRDFIQVWTNGTTRPSDGLTIRGNVLDIGSGSFTQSIFMRNEEVDTGRAGASMYYKNFLIEDNIIRNGHQHGITAGATDGLVIRNNTLLSVEKSDPEYQSTPQIKFSPMSQNVTVTQNAVSNVVYTPGATVNVSNNAYIQNTNSTLPGYYNDLFLESSMSGANGLADYVVMPGGMLDTLQAGASWQLLDTNPSTLTPNFDVSVSASNAAALSFDASYTFDQNGQVLPAGATFVWDFGDGTTATGQVVEHVYAALGDYDVTLTVQGASTSAQASTSLGLTGLSPASYLVNDGTASGGVTIPTSPSTGTPTSPTSPTTPTSPTAPTDPGTDTGTGTGTPTDTGGGPIQTPTTPSTLPTVDEVITDFSKVSSNKLMGGASVVTQNGETFLQLDKADEYARSGRIGVLEGSDQLAVEVEFNRAAAGQQTMTLLANRLDMALVLEGDGLRVVFGEAGQRWENGSVYIGNLGLDDAARHEATVLLDQASDRLQVFVDGSMVWDEQGQHDIEFSATPKGTQTRKDYWTVGTKWSTDFIGDVYELNFDSTAEFVDDALVVQDDAQLMA